MKRIALMSTLGLLLAATAAAHTAAPPRGHEVRLLHDCNDDYFGGDALGSATGHEVHALDLYEAWDSSLGDVLAFRITMAGEGPGDVQLTLKAGTASKTFAWSTSGGRWSGTFDKVEGPFQAEKADGTDDGDRFVLHGIVKKGTLGGTGSVLTDYRVQSSVDGDDADSMPGYDGAITGTCSDDFERPDYTIRGPIQYATLDIETSTIEVRPGQEILVQLTVANSLRDQAQRIMLTADSPNGIQVSMHNPATDAYTQTLSMDVNKKGNAGDGKIGHVAITGATAGASGTLDVVLTTNLGGRLVETINYRVAAEPTTANNPGSSLGAPNDDSPDVSNESPGIGALAAGLAVAFAARRHP